MASVVVTGFGVFAGVEDNPSKRIVEELQATGFVAKHASGTTFRILEVSVDHCSKLHDALITEHGDNQIFIHIGVDSNATSIKLEQCAYNNMNFRVPDVCGFQPQNSHINSSSELDSPLYSTLPLPQLCEEMNSSFPSTQEARPTVNLSQDPGRYLCNYTYYQALQHQHQLGQPLRAVFVHVPPFSVIPQETQVQVVKALVNRIAEVQ